MRTQSYRISRKSKVLIHALLIFGAILMMIPFVWMLLTSFKTLTESTQVPPVIIPKSFSFDNYAKALVSLPFKTFYFNTIFTTLMKTIGQLLFCSMAAYAFARLQFPGRTFIFLLCLSVLMVPGQVFIIPQYMIMKQLHWIDSLQALIVPGLFSVFGTFLLRQFFMTIPRELEEAAKLDGCHYVGIYWRIILPLAKPGLVALAIFTILWSWNDLLWPIIVNTSMQKMPLSAGLAYLQGEHFTNFPVLMAGSILAVWPMIIMFLFFQRYFIEGIALTGTKQ
ncbi:sugar ABC transporter permease [Paenibacillus selenitireducens]|uniref:Sugar ABC transporter permease n=1 Tax=Paenibacillus selenitireducens TaxID=1324314 RepID=A0A1T2XD83_9BACL|nr:carbohydrate ABC transporter permease [Paenibacillus selenitireducens]OPA77742.1 sugar ABC transporter permease [Paenibacillus selenitireducens]